MCAETRRTAKRLPIACELSEEGQRSRQEDISRELFSACKDVRELKDGYEFVFPGIKEWIEGLARFVAKRGSAAASLPSNSSSSRTWDRSR